MDRNKVWYKLLDNRQEGLADGALGLERWLLFLPEPLHTSQSESSPSLTSGTR